MLLRKADLKAGLYLFPNSRPLLPDP